MKQRGTAASKNKIQQRRDIKSEKNTHNICMYTQKRKLSVFERAVWNKQTSAIYKRVLTDCLTELNMLNTFLTRSLLHVLIFSCKPQGVKRCRAPRERTWLLISLT